MNKTPLTGNIQVIASRHVEMVVLLPEPAQKTMKQRKLKYAELNE